jgi:hypothetical protein
MQQVPPSFSLSNELYTSRYIVVSFTLSTCLTSFWAYRSVSGNSVKDHINYLGISMHAEDWSSCRIVMDYSKLKYQMDLKGNVVLSKQPSLSNDRGFSAQ